MQIHSERIMNYYARLLSAVVSGLLLIGTFNVAHGQGTVTQVEFVGSGRYLLDTLLFPHHVVQVVVTDEQQKPLPFVSVMFSSADTSLVDFVFDRAVTDTNGIAVTLVQTQVSTFPVPEALCDGIAITAIAQSISSAEGQVGFSCDSIGEPLFSGPFFGSGSNSFTSVSAQTSEPFTITGELLPGVFSGLPPSGTPFAVYSTDVRVAQADSAVSDSNLVHVTIHPRAQGIAHIIVEGIPPGAISISVPTFTAISEAAPPQALPQPITLGANYPNPLLSAGVVDFGTTITYHLSKPDNVLLQVFDVAGREIKTLVNQDQRAGDHSVFWDGRDQWGHQVASGVYIYQVEAGSLRASKTMLVVR